MASTTYSRIILPLDGSETAEQALPHVNTLASRLSLSIRLLHAVEPDSPAITQSLYSNRRWIEPASSRKADAKEYLERTASGLRDAGLDVDTVIPDREPATGIVEEAVKDSNALIAMASHGRSGLARWWMGSVADKVLHMADNPLLIIRVQEQGSASGVPALEKLIVPLDGSDVAEMALPHAALLASALGLPVKLLQVTPAEADYYSYLAAGPGMVPTSLPSSPSVPEMVEQADRESLGYLADVSASLTSEGVGLVETQVTQGAPADAIVDTATSEAGSIVVMTTHGRTGVGRMLLGSVADRVIRQSGCPVLLIRPGSDR